MCMCIISKGDDSRAFASSLVRVSTAPNLFACQVKQAAASHYALAEWQLLVDDSEYLQHTKTVNVASNRVISFCQHSIERNGSNAIGCCCCS